MKLVHINSFVKQQIENQEKIYFKILNSEYTYPNTILSSCTSHRFGNIRRFVIGIGRLIE
jgi:hypothetical protein